MRWVQQALDMVPCCSAGTGALETVMACLERRGTCDVSVPVDAAFGDRFAGCGLAGSLAHTGDSASKFFFEPSLTRPFPSFSSLIIGFATRESLANKAKQAPLNRC